MDTCPTGNTLEHSEMDEPRAYQTFSPGALTQLQDEQQCSPSSPACSEVVPTWGFSLDLGFGGRVQ